MVTMPTVLENPVPLIPFTAIGARFRPIAATMPPVTTGGIRVSIQRYHAFITARPISRYSTPAATMPPKAAGMPRLGPDPA